MHVWPSRVDRTVMSLASTPLTIFRFKTVATLQMTALTPQLVLLQLPVIAIDYVSMKPIALATVF